MEYVSLSDVRKYGIGDTNYVFLVAVVPFRSHGEGLPTTKFEALVEPDFRNFIAQDREEVVRHLHVVQWRVQIPHEAEKCLRFGPMQHRTMTQPGERRPNTGHLPVVGLRDIYFAQCSREMLVGRQ